MNDFVEQQIAMLCAKDTTIDDIRYPCSVSIKYDGIRGLTIAGQMRSRNNLLLANLHLQTKVAALPTILANLDGELVVGEPNAPDCYHVTQSVINSINKEGDFTYFVFDDLTEPGFPFEERQKMLQRRFMMTELPAWCVLVKQWIINSKDELLSLYSHLVSLGYEGVIVRSLVAPYVRARSTKKSNGMIRLKPRERSEFRVLGFEEAQKNNNVATISETGRTKRSSAKVGKVGKGTLGKINAQDIHSGVKFNIGVFKNLTAKDKQAIWDNQEAYMDKIGIYEFCPVGVIDLPRIASFFSWRDKVDI